MNIERELKLIAFAEANQGRPFTWGECDCNTFALEAMDAVHGTDLAAKIRGKYDSLLRAFYWRRNSPWGSLPEFLKEAGFVEVKKGFQQTGDIIIVEDPKWDMTHVCLGRNFIAAFPDRGVRVESMTALQGHEFTVWRLPCLL